MINIAEILKDCPKGTKLYSPICGNCKLLKIYNGLGLDVINDADEVFNFSYDGRYNLNGECCIFPSKENRDWNTFQKTFKDGDIISNNSYIAIFHKFGKPQLCGYDKVIYYHCWCYQNGKDFKFEKDFGIGRDTEYNFATDKEKQKLFDIIKANGYKWNPETKTLEKMIIPNFKVGDQIVRKNSISNSFIVNSVSSEYYGLALPDRTGIGVLNVSEQDDWELVPPIHKFKVGDKIVRENTVFPILTVTFVNDMVYTVKSNMSDEEHDIGVKIVENNYKIATFSPKDLKPFDRLLVKRHNTWQIAHFGYFKNGVVFTEMGQPCNIDVVPYNDETKHLLGTCDEYDGFYKWWN